MQKAKVDMINTSRALSLLPRLAQSSDADDVILQCLRLLLEVGFDNARFYTLDEDPVLGPVFILSACLPSPRELLNGYAIRQDDTALMQRGDPYSVVPSTYKAGMEHPRWVDDLGLLDRTSVDVPVIASGRLVGLLAADCSPQHIDLKPIDENVLKVVGMVAGSGTATQAVETTEEGAFETGLELSALECACESTKRLLEEGHGEIAALFRHDWRGNVLEKVFECLPSGKVLRDFPERYKVGEFLTGQAWERESLRYVPDFKLLEEDPIYRQLVSSDSATRHAKLLNAPVSSAVYGVLGETPEYLVRIFNRRVQRQQNFSSYRLFFSNKVDYESLRLRDLTARRRLSMVARTARAAAAHVTDPDRVLREAEPGLRDEGLEDYVLLCKIAGSHHAAYRYSGGDFRRLPHEIEMEEIPEALFKVGSDGGPGTVVDHDLLGAFASGLELHLLTLNETLGRPRRGQYALFRADGSQVRGLLIGRIRVTARKYAPSQAFPPAVCDAIQTLVQLCVDAVDAKFNHLTVHGARRAMGYIAHEMGTPLSILGDAAISAIMSTKEMAGQPGVMSVSDSRNLRNLLEAQYDKVQDSRGATNSALRLAPLVMQAGDGRLNLYVEKTSLYAELEAAKRQIIFKTRSRQQVEMGARGRDSQRVFTIDLADSLQGLPKVACDRYLVRQAFVALLDNAVKYSETRHRGVDMIIGISGQPSGSGYVTVSVQNWGAAIGSEEASLIFEPFVRGETDKSSSGARGMGLGLYVARLIASAHGGTLDVRLDKKQPRLTTFQMRIPIRLTEGIRQVDWSGGQVRRVETRGEK